MSDDLDLDLFMPRRGRKAEPPTGTYVRDLVPADLAMPVAAQHAKPIKAIRDSHHALARVLATGTGEAEASLVTGYTPSRISVLKADPQFQQLLEFYRGTATDAVADFRERMASMGLDALEELRDRLNDSPEDFSPALLNEVVKTMADRTGHAPQRGPTSVTQINVGLADRMRLARERVKVIDNE